MKAIFIHLLLLGYNKKEMHQKQINMTNQPQNMFLMIIVIEIKCLLN